MQIGVDFSGVIINSDVAKVATARRFLGIELEPQNTLQTLDGQPIDLELRAKLMSLLFCSSELLAAPSIEGASEYISKLQSQGVRITIVSNINPGGMSFAVHWLRIHGIFNVEFVSMGIGSSKSALLQHDFSVFIDDKLSNLLELEGIVPVKILLTRPYNRDVDVPASVIRAQDWQDICGHIRQYSKTSQNVNSNGFRSYPSPAR